MPYLHIVYLLIRSSNSFNRSCLRRKRGVHKLLSRLKSSTALYQAPKRDKKSMIPLVYTGLPGDIYLAPGTSCISWLIIQISYAYKPTATERTGSAMSLHGISSESVYTRLVLVLAERHRLAAPLLPRPAAHLVPRLLLRRLHPPKTTHRTTTATTITTITTAACAVVGAIFCCLCRIVIAIIVRQGIGGVFEGAVAGVTSLL